MKCLFCNGRIEGCPACKGEGEIEEERMNERKAAELARDLIKSMNGLSAEGFDNRIRNDPFFCRGFDEIINMIMKANKK